MMVCEWASRPPEVRSILRFIVVRKSKISTFGQQEYLQDSQAPDGYRKWATSRNLATVYTAEMAAALALVLECGVVELED